MKIKLLAGIALAAVCAASGASAQDTGWYGAVDAGYHWPTGIDAQSSGNAADGKAYDWKWSSAAEYIQRIGREEVERRWREYPLLNFGQGWDD